MDNLKEVLENELVTLESNIKTYNAFTLDKTNPEDDRKLVAFKLFFEMVAFNHLLGFFPEYSPSKETVFLMVNAFKGVNTYVTVEDGKVKISPAYYDLLKQKEELLKKQKSN